MGAERLCGTFANIVVLQAFPNSCKATFARSAVGVVEPLDGQRGKQRAGWPPAATLTLLGEGRQVEVIGRLCSISSFSRPVPPG